ncbi:Uncharacterised protein [Mycobacteroides abscessus subsp. abscessus]|nr:Uncharacterised protein [Mycobacteroides abscessus subsp. abscessus]
MELTSAFPRVWERPTVSAGPSSGSTMSPVRM